MSPPILEQVYASQPPFFKRGFVVLYRSEAAQGICLSRNQYTNNVTGPNFTTYNIGVQFPRVRLTADDEGRVESRLLSNKLIELFDQVVVVVEDLEEGRL